MYYLFTIDLNPIPAYGYINQIHLMTLIYDSAVQKKSDGMVWSIIALFLIIFSGFISTVSFYHNSLKPLQYKVFFYLQITYLYIILKAINLEMRKRWYWWQLTLAVFLIGFMLSCAVLLRKHFQIVHLFDHYIVGNIVLITVILEVFVFVFFYGE